MRADYSICPVCKKKLKYGRRIAHMEKEHPDYKSDQTKHEVIKDKPCDSCTVNKQQAEDGEVTCFKTCTDFKEWTDAQK